MKVNENLFKVAGYAMKDLELDTVSLAVGDDRLFSWKNGNSVYAYAWKFIGGKSDVSDTYVLKDGKWEVWL